MIQIVEEEAQASSVRLHKKELRKQNNLSKIEAFVDSNPTLLSILRHHLSKQGLIDSCVGLMTRQLQLLAD
jgi:hypothetical protein